MKMITEEFEFVNPKEGENEDAGRTPNAHYLSQTHRIVMTMYVEQKAT